MLNLDKTSNNFVLSKSNILLDCDQTLGNATHLLTPEQNPVIANDYEVCVVNGNANRS